jgi:hypothetical protein
MNYNKINLAGYDESPIYGPSEHNPPKIEFDLSTYFVQKEVSESLPGVELSDTDSLKYFFHKYISSVESGKPNQRMANDLKSIIDVIQVKNLTNEQPR